MKTGKLDRRVTIQVADETVSPNGDIIKAWGVSHTVWANYKPLSDSEKNHFGSFEVERGRFTIRWFKGFEQALRGAQIVLDGRTFQVDGAKEISRRFMVEITAQNVDNA